MVDWDSNGRTQTVDVLDGSTGAVLDTRSVANFSGGQYWVWSLGGHVVLRFTSTAGANSVVSGIFFDGSSGGGGGGGSNYITTYAYDTLGHLTSVSMPRPSGTQTRTFNYGNPPGAQLLSATNPENGTVTYTYNSDQTLATKTDAKNQQVQYSYDSYKRVTQIRRGTYNGTFTEDTCQQENYTYDAGTYGQGRLTGLQYKGGFELYPGLSSCYLTFTEGFIYNSPGGITSQSLGVSEPAQNYSSGGNISATVTAGYTYDNEGRITATQYPSSGVGNSWVPGPNIGNTFDSMGRLLKVTDLAASSDIISNATYGPMGQLLTMTAGPTQGTTETRSYNSIGQLTQVSSCVNSYGTCTATLNAQYNYSATQNNGKITSQQDLLSGEQITYTYDSLNRLASATGYGWGQSYGYDGFGNMTNQTVTSGTAPALNTTYDPATNRQTGECADANGNVDAQSGTSPCTSGYNFDVENRIVAESPVWLGTPTVAYAYKPGNKRVWKGTGYNGPNTPPTTEELTFWSIGGQKLVTYSLTQYQPNGPNTLPLLWLAQTGTNYYFGGKLIKNTGGFVTPDRLGSIGKYFPYGQERPSATTDGKEKFATYFRDSETGLDYANARYHEPGMGRFMTPDPYMASGGPSDPGSWNRYSYVEGDPINSFDPTGQYLQAPGTPGAPPVDSTGLSCPDALALLIQTYGTLDNVPFDILGLIYMQGCDASKVTPADPGDVGGGQPPPPPCTLTSGVRGVAPGFTQAASPISGNSGMDQESGCPSGPLSFGFMNCAKAVADLNAAILLVSRRLAEIAAIQAAGGIPDYNHLKSLAQALTQLKEAEAKVEKHCGNYGPAAAALAAAAAAIEEAGLVLAVP
jgi:RHS repeat-associated protein